MEEVKFIEKTTSQSDNGYIYVIKMDNYYKIGKTKNPKERFGEYTLLPKEPTIICCECVSFYSKVETDLHKKYKEKALRGEWFALDEKDVEEIKQILSKVKTNEPIIENAQETIDFFEKKVKLPKQRNKIKELNQDKVISMLRGFPATFFALSVMKGNMTNKNIVEEKGNKYRCVDLAKDMETTRQSAHIHIKRLKELNIVAEVLIDDKKYFCINPDYYKRGENESKIPQKVVDAFKKK